MLLFITMYFILSVSWLLYFWFDYYDVKYGYKKYLVYDPEMCMRDSAIAVLLTPVWPLAVIGCVLYGIYRFIKTVPEIVRVALGRKSQ